MHAIRLLTGADPICHDARPSARQIYSEAVREALIVLWEASDRICGKRLKPLIPILLEGCTPIVRWTTYRLSFSHAVCH